MEVTQKDLIKKCLSGNLDSLTEFIGMKYADGETTEFRCFPSKRMLTEVTQEIISPDGKVGELTNFLVPLSPKEEYEIKVFLLEDRIIQEITCLSTKAILPQSLNGKNIPRRDFVELTKNFLQEGRLP